MEISSELGKGTMVHLWLPRAKREDVPKTREPSLTVASVNGSRGSRVLLVHDDSLDSMNIAYMLMDLGHSVLESPPDRTRYRFWKRMRNLM